MGCCLIELNKKKIPDVAWRAIGIVRFSKIKNATYLLE
jgi:hypothetical protein